MKTLFILTTHKVYQGYGAAERRLMNTAKALQIEGVRVYLCPVETKLGAVSNNIRQLSDGIFLISSGCEENKAKSLNFLLKLIAPILVIKYLNKIINFAKTLDGDKAFYIYSITSVSLNLGAILLIGKINKFKLFCDIVELPTVILQSRTLPSSIFKRLIHPIDYSLAYLKYCIIEFLIRYYKGVVVISTNLEKYFRNYIANILRVPILADISQGLPSYPQEYVKGYPFLICYAGMLGLRKIGFDILYKALGELKKENIAFELHLYGPVYYSEKELLLKSLPVKYGIIKNIFYHGPIIDPLILQKEMRKNNLLLSLNSPNLQAKFALSTKLSEYLVSGVPVLASNVSDNALYIKDGYSGFIVEPGDSVQLAEKIKTIIASYNQVKDKISENGYLAAKKYFDYANFSKALFNFFFN